MSYLQPHSTVQWGVVAKDIFIERCPIQQFFSCCLFCILKFWNNGRLTIQIVVNPISNFSMGSALRYSCRVLDVKVYDRDFGGPFVPGDQIRWGPSVQWDQIMGDSLSRETRSGGLEIWGTNGFGTKCPRSSTCALRDFFWLLSHVIYFKLTRELQECLLSQASIFEW